MNTPSFHKIVYGLFILVSFGYSQRVYVETGFSGATFKDFSNDLEQQTLFDGFSRPQQPGTAIGILFNHYSDVIWLNLGMQYNNYLINTSINNENDAIPLTYDFSFFSLKTGANVRIADFSKIRLGIHGHISQGWLTQGLRTYGNSLIDLLEDDFFYQSLLSYHFGGNIEVNMVKDIALYLSYDIKSSFKKNKVVDENYRIKAATMSVGLLFDLTKKDKDPDFIKGQ